MRTVKNILRRLVEYKYLSLFFVLCPLSFSLVRANLEKTEFLNVREIQIESADDVISVDDSLVVPVLYPNVKGMTTLEGEDLKQRFVDIVLPAVLIAKYRIDSLRDKVMHLKRKKAWERSDSLFYNEMAEKYEAEDHNDLLLKMHTHPNSIVLAQAAMESGWGTSRFCRQANNLFGIWSFDPDEPRVRATYKRGSKPIYVRKYKDISESIEDYFLVLAKSRAYESFRKSRLKDSDPYQMVNHLVRYSENRWKYVSLVKLLMRKNGFTRYDSYMIDPQYYVLRTNVKWLN